jgi:uncharacterized protein (DUF362 family)
LIILIFKQYRKVYLSEFLEQRNWGLPLAVKVAVAHLSGNDDSFREALKQIGTIEDLNSSSTPVVIKVGVFNHQAQNHTSVEVLKAIIDSFTKAPKIYIVESDNYIGKGLERLQIWKQLFNERVVPFNLSEDSNLKKVKVADEEIGLSHLLFKPNVFVSTHILRKYERGSILKNLLGLIPDPKKARFHRKLEPALLDMYEAIGGIDLAVLDGTYLRYGTSSNPHIGPNGDKYKTATDVVLLGRDPVAVETVGLFLAGLNPEKTPIIQEAVKRKLGTGDMKKIRIVGDSLERLEEEVALGLRAFKKSRPKGAQTWGGRANQAFKELMNEGYFRLPNKRTIDDITTALQAKGLETQDKKDKIMAALIRRVKNGALQSSKNLDRQLFWTE